MIEKNSGMGRLKIGDVSRIHDMTLGYNSDEFVIAINRKEKDSYEGIYAIPADKLSEIISLLFGAGLEYQERMGIDIGFGIGDINDESTE